MFHALVIFLGIWAFACLIQVIEDNTRAQRERNNRG